MGILLFSSRIIIGLRRYSRDLRKPFDISLKGSFHLINVVILLVVTKKTLKYLYGDGS